MNTTYTATEIAKKLNEMGYAYYGDKAKAWEGKGQSRIYFGKDYLTLLDGELTNRNLRKVRALTIGDPALDAAIEAIEALDAESALLA